MTDTNENLGAEVAAELRRAVEKHGPQSMPVTDARTSAALDTLDYAYGAHFAALRGKSGTDSWAEAWIEEVFELVEELAHVFPDWDKVAKEAAQVAAMAMRVAEAARLEEVKSL